MVVAADIAAAFVLLVAGGCARAVAQPLWRRFVHWWHTEGNEPAEFKFMDRLVESMAAKPRGWHHCRVTNMWRKWCASQKVCPDCGQRLPKHGEDEEGGPPRAVEEVKQKMYEEHVGTKNAGKVPIDGNEWYHEQLEKARQELSKEEFARLQRRLKRAKEWRRRGESTTQRERLED